MNPFTTEERIGARIACLNACRKIANSKLAKLPGPRDKTEKVRLRRLRRELRTLIRDCRKHERALKRMTSARSRGALTLFA